MTLLYIPIYGEPDLPWSFFLIQAARGSVRVPGWVQAATPAVVSARLGRSPEEVDEYDLDACMSNVPAYPILLLETLLKPLQERLPAPTDPLRLRDEQVTGSSRPAVRQYDLLHDVAVIMQVDYSIDTFYAYLEALEDPEDWDARLAVAAMLYLVQAHMVTLAIEAGREPV